MSKFKPVVYLSHNGYDPVEHNAFLATLEPDMAPSLTVQSQAEDADINVLMRKYGLLGGMPENPRVPMYGDFTGVNDFQSALEAVRLADEMFMEFPAEVRARFQNNPQLLMDFCADDKNVDEARKLGLLKPAKSPAEAAPVPLATVPAAPASQPALAPVAPAPGKTV